MPEEKHGFMCWMKKTKWIHGVIWTLIGLGTGASFLLGSTIRFGSRVIEYKKNIENVPEIEKRVETLENVFKDMKSEQKVFMEGMNTKVASMDRNVQKLVDRAIDHE